MLALLMFILIGGVMLLGAGVIIAFFGWAFFGDSWKKKAEAKYQAELPQRFNGAGTVAWDVSLSNTGTPKKQQLIDDAQRYGYELDHMSSNNVAQTLVFKRVA